MSPQSCASSPTCPSDVGLNTESPAMVVYHAKSDTQRQVLNVHARDHATQAEPDELLTLDAILPPQCDETRPQCANCTVVGRECRFAEAHIPASERASRGQTTLRCISPQADTTSTLSASASASLSPGLQRPSSASTTTGVSSGASHHVSPVSTASAGTAPPDVPPFASSVPPHIHNLVNVGVDACAARDDETDQQVNMNHMELLIHFSATVVAPDLDPELIEIGTSLVLQKGVDNACLLHQILALSARHLSLRRPAQYDFYCRQAMRLQTKAIELFNATTTIDQSNCEALLLFSSLLNQHLLTDVLSNREGDFADFLDRFVESAKLQRGVRVITSKRWPFLLESDLSPLLRWGSTESLSSPTVGEECDLLRKLISVSTMDPVAKESCRTAIHYLQVGFDDSTSPSMARNRYCLVARWSIFLPPQFLDLLKQRRPEAVTVMGWYAVLLEYGRQNWAVGDAGIFILRGVASFLGVEWAHWLEWPQAIMADRLS